MIQIESHFDLTEVVAVACAVHRKQGFVKKGSLYQPVQDDDKKTPNVNYLYSHFCNNDRFSVQPCDVADAEAIVEYLKGLAFKAFERKLTEFENNVLKFVNSSTVRKDMLGIAASLPNVYQTKLIADQWTDREIELGRSSNFVGTVRQSSVFSLKIENIRNIVKTNSCLVSCSENNANIVKFFFNAPGKPQPVCVGQDVTVRGYVKSHNVSTYTGFKETMLNRIKILQPS